MVPLNVPLFIARDAADFRKQADGLAGLVRNSLGRNPMDESLYIFFNRRRDQVKILYYRPGGFCLWWKRLERGTFARLAITGDACEIRLTSTELLMLIDGISLQAREQRKRYIKRG